MPHLLLVPSQLLGAAVWRPAQRELAARGVAATVVAFPPDLRTPSDVLAAVERAAHGMHGPVLVPHSNAGYFAPQLAEQLDATATVYVDAALALAEGRTPLAPPRFLDQLAELADGRGLLPPWTSWWPDEDVAALFPSDDVRRELEAEQPRLPLAYFRETVTVPAGWHDRPSAYLAFGDTYADEQARAREWGWPTAVLAGGHLHQLHEPGEVTAKILKLLGALNEELSSPR